MFLPSEAFLTAAEEQDAGLWDYAVRNNVILATPTNLLTLLRTVAYVWRQEAVTENAQKVIKLGRELHERLGSLASKYNQLGKSIGKVVAQYNSTIGTFESRVMVSARRMSELEVSSVVVEELASIDAAPRELAVADEILQEPGSVSA